MSDSNETKKKFKLSDLEVDSFVTTLSEEEQIDLLGGHGPNPSTNCGNPAHGCPPKVKQTLAGSFDAG
jgi:hypothetical protein